MPVYVWGFIGVGVGAVLGWIVAAMVIRRMWRNF